MIHGITPRVAETGKIKLGGLGQERPKHGGGTFRMPVKYEDFVITKTYRNAAGDLVRDAELMASIAHDPDGKLRSIPIVLHSDEIDEVFPTQYARYAGKKLHCSGDGKTAVRWEFVKDDKGVMTRTGESKQMECPCPFLTDGDDKRGPSCKPHATLYCSLAVSGLAVAGAIYTFRTTSIITIQSILGSLMQIKKMTGMLQGLPLHLVVQPVRTEKALVYCAHIELRAKDVIEAQRTALESAKMRGTLIGEVADLNRSYRAMLTAPADESDEEQGEVAAEFYPEENTPAPEDAPQTATANLLAKRKKRGAPQATTQPQTVAQTPPHNPDTGESTDPTDYLKCGCPKPTCMGHAMPAQSEALLSVLAGIAKAEDSQQLTPMFQHMKKLSVGEKDIATREYRAKQNVLDAKAKEEATKATQQKASATREPGSDG
jgi:hypothetical protein